MRRPSIAYGSGVFVVYLAIWVSLTSFYPTYLTEVKHLSPTAAALLFGLFFAVGVLIKPLSGSLYDRVGIRRAVLVIAPIPTIGLIALPLVEGVRSLAIVTILISPILGSGTISQSFLIIRFHDDLKSTGLGVVRTCGMTVSAITPIIFGAVADRGFFDEAFLSLSVLVGLLVFVVLRIPTEWTR